MARRPARLERAGALTPRDRMWAAMRALQFKDSFPWSPIEVLHLANLRGGEPLHVESVLSYIESLARAAPPYVQLVARDEPGGRKRRELWLYDLVRDVGIDAPRVTTDGKPVTGGQAHEQLWIAMKAWGSGSFDCTALMQAVRDARGSVSLSTVKTYVTYLCRAGYLALEQHGHRGLQARYRFVRSRNTGPRAPLITKAGEVLDANTGRIVWPEGAAK